jgi:hypothetical protein
VALHGGICGLSFSCIHLTVQQLEAAVDVAIRLQLSELEFETCHLTPAHLPALTRLITGCPFLETCKVGNNGQPLVFGDGVPAFCAALRGSPLKHLKLGAMRLWESLPDGLAVLDALTGHGCLTQLDLSSSSAAANRSAVGAALGRLVVESRLLSPHVSGYSLGAGLRPLFEALPENRTLRSLYCSYNSISRECARDVILPAVRANASLQTLHFRSPGLPDTPKLLLEAEQLVAARQ